LIITKPFWAKPQFIAAVLIAAFLIIISVTKYIIKQRLDRKETRHAEEIKFLQSEYKAMNALMNPHFIFNSLNSIQSLVNTNNTDAANEYLQYFSELVRQNMHNISQDLIPLQKELHLVENYLVHNAELLYSLHDILKAKRFMIQRV